ncbi:MAG: hypothetical protein BWY75_03672 [bacterium ADurb.Bin425]|nr:MAG: hypothetical protein BWY75_03672 [bacterium ADurb.Bin425]
MGSHDAVLGGIGCHSHYFQSTEVGRQKSQSTNPSRNDYLAFAVGGIAMPGKKKVFSRVHIFFELETDTKHKNKVNKHHKVVD